jgi:hypothetical protein
MLLLSQLYHLLELRLLRLRLLPTGGGYWKYPY